MRRICLVSHHDGSQRGIRHHCAAKAKKCNRNYGGHGRHSSTIVVVTAIFLQYYTSVLQTKSQAKVISNGNQGNLKHASLDENQTDSSRAAVSHSLNNGSDVIVSVNDGQTIFPLPEGPNTSQAQENAKANSTEWVFSNEAVRWVENETWFSEGASKGCCPYTQQMCKLRYEDISSQSTGWISYNT